MLEAGGHFTPVSIIDPRDMGEYDRDHAGEPYLMAVPRTARNGDAFRRYAPQFFAILHPVTGKEGR